MGERPWENETPEETAARWRRENDERGRHDQRGATLISAAAMDRKTAASIRAQRNAARVFDGQSAEEWSDAYQGDVAGIFFEVVAANPRWGVWYKHAWDKLPGPTIVLAYDERGERCVGWTSVGEVRACPIDRSAPVPNRHLPIENLRAPWWPQEGDDD